MTVHTKDAGADLRRSTWMAEAQAGDSAAYQTLLRDCIPVIKTVARRRGVAADHVDDVVQDVLLTIHRARHTYDPAGHSQRGCASSPSGARSISSAVFAGRIYVRCTRRSRSKAMPIKPPPARGLAYADAAGIVTRAIADLPARQREAVERIVLEERSLADAAALTQRSKISLKVNLHRALKTLRDSIKP